ncbi:MAG: histidinol-phosphate transaminase, partial [Chloroflexi bacterium]|nr:histidinol-phosphate transaminase [Chloroflexota bacterium]
PAALKALAELDGVTHIYPDPESRKLREKIAEYVNVPIEYVFVGHGSDEIIDLLMRLFLSPGDPVLTSQPTFGMYRFDADVSAANLVDVPRRSDYTLDLPAIEEAVYQTRAKLFFLANPNNPTGTPVTEAEIDFLLSLPIIVVSDEAYCEFTGDAGAATRVPDTPNLITLRTFSKWAGLAGLRVGYGIMPLWIMEHMWKIKQPYNVSVSAQAAALASLEDLPRLLDNVARIITERERLYLALESIDYLKPYPTAANFVLCRVVGGQLDALTLKTHLAKRGILVRYYNKPGLENCLRITVGKPDQTDRLVDVLREIGESL